MAAGIPLVHPPSGGTYTAVDEDHAKALEHLGWQPAPETPVAALPARPPRPAPPAPGQEA